MPYYPPAGSGGTLARAVYLEDFGAVGDGVADDSAAFRAALAANPQGIVYGKANKVYGVTQDGANPWCIRIQNACSLDLNGSWIMPLASVGSGVDGVAVIPQVSGGAGIWGWDFWSLKNLAVGTNTNGTRRGRYGLLLDTTANGALLPRIRLENVHLYGSTTGSQALASNGGGIFCSTISQCYFDGGAFLYDCGDSIAIDNCTATGPNIGFDIKQTGGATKVSISNCNITSIGGAIVVKSGQNIAIEDCNIELFGAAPGGSNGAVIDCNGATSTIIGLVIKGNMIGGAAAAGITSLVRVRNAIGVTIRDNDMVSNSGTLIPWLNLDGASDITVGRQYFGTADGGTVIGVSVGNIVFEPVTTLGAGQLLIGQTKAPPIAQTNLPVTNLNGGSGASATTFWRGDGTWATPAGGGGGSGDVTAAAPFGTDNRLVRSDGTGKGVQASAVTLDDSGNISALGNVTGAATPNGAVQQTNALRVMGQIIAAQGGNQNGDGCISIGPFGFFSGNNWEGNLMFGCNLVTDSAGNATNYRTPVTHASLGYMAIDAGSGGFVKVYNSPGIPTTAGALVTPTPRITIGQGVQVGAPTGGDKGAGTLNANAVYDDNVVLTCYVLDAAMNGSVNLPRWDAKVANYTEYVIDEEIVTDEDGGQYPITTLRLDANGKPVKRLLRERIHEPARKFAARLGTDYDPLDINKYIKHWRDKGHLTSFPNPDKFDPDDSDPKLSVGTLVQCLVEAVEIQAVHIATLNAQVTVLAAKVSELEITAPK